MFRLVVAVPFAALLKAFAGGRVEKPLQLVFGIDGYRRIGTWWVAIPES